MWFFSITVHHRSTSFRIWAENSSGELVPTGRPALGRAAFAACTMERKRADSMQAIPTIEFFTMAPIGWVLI
ncbi:hypothetical protein ASC92_27535 [Variovorax sp. Root411]|nr:hypothetical protein ASC92_27535 [Variovorax sp. Root411]